MAQVERSVSVQHIFLDTENPRHDAIDNEKAIVARLIGHEQVMSLATDIADEGLSPLDRLAVIPHSDQKGRYVAIEGNRRVCAIKLLADPDLAPTQALRKSLVDLKRSARHSIDAIDVVCFGTRGEARHWLDVRHGNAGPGVSTRSWNATQKARFDAGAQKRRNPNALALDLVDYAVSRGLLYQYVQGNPATFVDPSGLLGISESLCITMYTLSGGMMGAAAGGAAAAPGGVTIPIGAAAGGIYGAGAGFAAGSIICRIPSCLTREDTSSPSDADRCKAAETACNAKCADETCQQVRRMVILSSFVDASV